MMSTAKGRILNYLGMNELVAVVRLSCVSDGNDFVCSRSKLLQAERQMQVMPQLQILSSLCFRFEPDMSPIGQFKHRLVRQFAIGIPLGRVMFKDDL